MRVPLTTPDFRGRAELVYGVTGGRQNPAPRLAGLPRGVLP